MLTFKHEQAGKIRSLEQHNMYGKGKNCCHVIYTLATSVTPGISQFLAIVLVLVLVSLISFLLMFSNKMQLSWET